MRTCSAGDSCRSRSGSSPNANRRFHASRGRPAPGLISTMSSVSRPDIASTRVDERRGIQPAAMRCTPPGRPEPRPTTTPRLLQYSGRGMNDWQRSDVQNLERSSLQPARPPCPARQPASRVLASREHQGSARGPGTTAGNTVRPGKPDWHRDFREAPATVPCRSSVVPSLGEHLGYGRRRPGTSRGSRSGVGSYHQ